MYKVSKGVVERAEGSSAKLPLHHPHSLCNVVSSFYSLCWISFVIKSISIRFSYTFSSLKQMRKNKIEFSIFTAEFMALPFFSIYFITFGFKFHPIIHLI